MPFTHTVRYQVDRPGESLAFSVQRSDDSETHVVDSIPDATTDMEIVVAIDVSEITVLFMSADGGAITVETNDGVAPDDTIALVDGFPLVWISGGGAGYPACPLGTDVTSIFCTNSSGAASELNVWVLQDPTP